MFLRILSVFLDELEFTQGISGSLLMDQGEPLVPNCLIVMLNLPNLGKQVLFLPGFETSKFKVLSPNGDPRPHSM